MLFAISIGRFTLEVTRSDLLLKLGKREIYWSRDTGLAFDNG
jgi:hypothetical protein